MSIRIGAQLNCWPLGKLEEELITAINEAGEIGFAGVETNARMVNYWGNRREQFKEVLAGAGVALSALFLVVGPIETTDREQEIADALRAAEVIQSLGASRLMIGGGKATEDADVFKAACDHFSELGRRVLGEYGVKACYHLHHGAIASSAEEIARMMDLTDDNAWFLCPDSGIMVREGHDLLQIIETCFSRIAYVHFKDWDGGEKWSMLGGGVVDHAGVLAKLDALGYDGWVVSENESRNPDLTPKQQQAADRAWLRAQGY